MELIFYNHNKEIPKQNWKFDEAILFSFPEKDLKIIKHDWEKIHHLIVTGHAEDITEGLTDYLTACTKGTSAKSLRKQPYSSVIAKQRAYSLKVSYMIQILRRYVLVMRQIQRFKKKSLILRRKIR